MFSPEHDVAEGQPDGFFGRPTLSDAAGGNNVLDSTSPVVVANGLRPNRDPRCKGLGVRDMPSYILFTRFARARVVMSLFNYLWERSMSGFDDREKGFEKKFAHDADLKFKAESRRNKAIAEWAAAKMGLTGSAVEDYIKAVRREDLVEKGDDDVVRKISKDLAAVGVQIADADIRKQMNEFLAKAVDDIQGTK